jgi:hypothetical protein
MSVTVDGIQAVLQKLEGLVGEKLPEDYRVYMLSQNGSIPCGAPCRIVVDGTDDEGLAVDYFYECCSPNPSIDIEEANADNQKWPFVPIDSLAIGVSPVGDHFCLGLAGEFLGKVFYVDHELFCSSVSDGRKTLGLAAEALPDGVILVAVSFGVFLRVLGIS